jgi:hypothetical protein
LSVEAAGEALVVRHGPPGEANRVGVALDRLAWPDVVGTIADDDTHFLAVMEGTAQLRVMGEAEADEGLRRASLRRRGMARRRTVDDIRAVFKAAGASERN